MAAKPQPHHHHIGSPVGAARYLWTHRNTDCDHVVGWLEWTAILVVLAVVLFSGRQMIAAEVVLVLALAAGHLAIFAWLTTLHHHETLLIQGKIGQAALLQHRAQHGCTKDNPCKFAKIIAERVGEPS